MPIGTQDASLLDVRFNDSDQELFGPEDDEAHADQTQESGRLRTEAEFQQRAAHIYATYAGPLKRRFRWLRANCFLPQLSKDLRADITALLSVLKQCGAWDPRRDAKLAQLIVLMTHRHPGEKILVFSQFADTVRYLAAQLQASGIKRVGAATGDTDDPTKLAWHFSPVSNNKRAHVSPDNGLDILIATDVLSEGQNLQDAAIVVNYDLPWAIIRLTQRADRVDRIGQQAATIMCHSFLPAAGVERIIRLRARVRQRLQENVEVVGSDEAFFDDDQNDQAVRSVWKGGKTVKSYLSLRYRRLKWTTMRVMTHGAKRKRMALRIRHTMGDPRYVGKVHVVCSAPKKRPEGRRKDFACNDAIATARQIVVGYRLRWTVERFHKDMKQHLGCEDVATRGFDAVTSHVHWGYCASILLSMSPPGVPPEVKSIGDKQRTVQHYLGHKEKRRILQQLSQIGGVERYQDELRQVLADA